MTVSAVKPQVPIRLRLRWVYRTLAALLGLPALGLLAAWAYGPYWIAPVEDFTQGPSGAIAYVSLYNQLQSQSDDFWNGRDVRFELDQAEFAAMLSSALLSGQTSESPIRKVRAALLDGEIRVETIVRLPNESIPARYRGPIGLKLRLTPDVADNGLIRFRITRATVGRIPVPPRLIQWGSRFLNLQAAGFDPTYPAVMLPVGDMVASQLGRRVNIREFTADQGKLTLMIAMDTNGTDATE